MAQDHRPYSLNAGNPSQIEALNGVGGNNERYKRIESEMGGDPFIVEHWQNNHKLIMVNAKQGAGAQITITIPGGHGGFRRAEIEVSQRPVGASLQNQAFHDWKGTIDETRAAALDHLVDLVTGQKYPSAAMMRQIAELSVQAAQDAEVGKQHNRGSNSQVLIKEKLVSVSENMTDRGVLERSVQTIDYNARSTNLVITTPDGRIETSVHHLKGKGPADGMEIMLGHPDEVSHQVERNPALAAAIRENIQAFNASGSLDAREHGILDDFTNRAVASGKAHGQPAKGRGE